MSTIWVRPETVTLLLLALAFVSLVVHFRRRARMERSQRAAAERALQHATQLSELGAAVSRATDGAEVARAALEELLHAFDATAGAVLLVAEPGGRADLVHAVGYEAQLIGSSVALDVPAQTPVTEAIRRSDLVLIASHADRRDRFPNSHDEFLSVHEGAAVIPLVAAHRALGAIALSFAAPRAFDDGDHPMMLAAGRYTGQALARARLYERAEQARTEGEAFRVRADAELRERQRAEEALRESEGKYRALAGRTSRLYELSAALSQAMTLDAVSKVIVRSGLAVAGASAGSVAMVIDGGRQFETLYAERYTRPVEEARPRFPADPGFCCTEVAATGEPVYVASLAEWQKRYPRSAASAADGGYASAAVIPLMVEGAVLAVLSFHFAAPVNFTDDYTALLRSVAQHCGQALDRARLYEAAQRARADAESANRAKDEFLSTVSHELRTPLTAMLGWASMLRGGTLDPSRTTRALEAIFSNATRQAQLIEDLLDVSRIVAGRASLDLDRIDVSEAVRGVVETIMPLAESKKLELCLENVPNVSVVADRRRLEQVFLNLTSNAVKFTPEGGRITVDGAVAGGSVDVRVTDTGTGIEPAFLPHVFERFRQADGSAARRVGGLGLGLFIARHLVEAQGGTIRVDSEGAGRGTTFTVRLPIAAPENLQAPPTALITSANDTMRPPVESSLIGIRVLLVDDEPDVREVMASALETRGATVTSAGSARDALHTLAKSDFDVLLADIAMPEKDGYELIREIRKLPSISARIPAAAVTAFAGEEDRQRALAEGFQAHVAKPVSPAALAQAVADLVNLQPQR